MEERNLMVSRDELNKRGFRAIIGVAGAVVLGVLVALPIPLGPIIGGMALVGGIGAFCLKQKEYRVPAITCIGIGFLTLAAKIGIQSFRPFASLLLGVSAGISLGFGIWNIIRFFKGLKTRR
ncbi:MAG: hypothetical protein LBQ77_04285 [Treponema sp.]|jgi:predicted benzoate:H+ symporter BenE|nr:hypothetical protein [Treponema sp.]